MDARGATFGPILILLALAGGAGWWLLSNEAPGEATPTLELRGKPIRAPSPSPPPPPPPPGKAGGGLALAAIEATHDAIEPAALVVTDPAEETVTAFADARTVAEAEAEDAGATADATVGATEGRADAPSAEPADSGRTPPHYAGSLKAPTDTGAAAGAADDAILDVSFLDLYLNDFVPPEPGQTLGPDREPTTFPENVLALDGRRVTIEGFMLPSTFEDDAVSEFILSGDPPGCCFGGVPAFDQWIEVTMSPDAEKPEYDPFVLYTVTGRLEVGEVINEYELLDSLYRMTGEAVASDW